MDLDFSSACFDEAADTSQCENQSIGRRDA